MAQDIDHFNFETPFISQGTYQINIDQLESLIWDPSARRTGRLDSLLDFEKSSESITIFTSLFRRSHQKRNNHNHRSPETEHCKNPGLSRKIPRTEC